ncbi:MAG: hypothetical protein U1A27_14060 [Phycisphaerae bacterium]
MRLVTRKKLLIASILTGGFVLQLGSCAAGALNFALGALDLCALTLSADCTIGPFAPCGIPDVRTFDTTTGALGAIQNREDDLLLDCPVTLIPVMGGGS